MKNSVKNLSLVILAFSISSFLFSCKKESALDTNAINDDQLIEAIQVAKNKQAVVESQLPGASQTTIKAEYTESFTNEALLAPDLGYEVQLRKGKGSTVGELHYVYFNLQGRKLQYNKGNYKEGKRGYNKGSKDCFNFVLPISLTMPDSSIITIENKEDWGNVKAWYKANPDTKERAALIFPVNVIFSDGSTETVINEGELKELREKCIEERHEQCFEFIYPITFIMPDESEILVSDKGDYDAIKAWYEGNPETKERPTLKFPVDVIMPENDTLTINTKEEIEALKDICNKEYRHNKDKCFELVLPVTVSLADSSMVIIETPEDWQKVKEWCDANPEAEGKPALVFPVEIIYADGTSQTVNSQEEMDVLKEDCPQEGMNQRREGTSCHDGGSGGEKNQDRHGNRGGH